MCLLKGRNRGWLLIWKETFAPISKMSIDAYREDNFCFCLMLCTINDFLTYGNMSDYSLKGLGIESSLLVVIHIIN